MLPKDTPYPFDSVPEENYYGEFRELSSSIVPSIKKDKANPDKEESDDAFNEFSIFPKV